MQDLPQWLCTLASKTVGAAFSSFAAGCVELKDRQTLCHFGCPTSSEHLHELCASSKSLSVSVDIAHVLHVIHGNHAEFSKKTR